MIRHWLWGDTVDVTAQATLKWLPNNPPRKGEIVLVDRRRCRVTRVKVRWDGANWKLRELWVKPTDPPRSTLTGELREGESE